jgi:catechol 2,3-dioxygenase-like lactoylglutathione lyase family enzyme
MISDQTHVTVLVEGADDAVEWYTDKLGFERRDDEAYAPGMRWVTVAPGGRRRRNRTPTTDRRVRGGASHRDA